MTLQYIKYDLGHKKWTRTKFEFAMRPSNMLFSFIRSIFISELYYQNLSQPHWNLA